MNNLAQDLKSFTGTHQCYKHSFNEKLNYTDGVRFFARNAGGGAYWFLDILATSVFDLHKIEEFLLIEMEVIDTGAVIKVTDGNEDSAINFTQIIEYTDCPEGNWNFFMIWGGERSIILLPSEY